MITKTNFLNKILILALLFSLNCIGSVDESILQQEIKSTNREECNPNNADSKILSKIKGKRILGPRRKILCPGANIDEIPPAVIATPGEGRYGTAQTVTLTRSEEAVIYYTVDGTSPSANSIEYTDPIVIADNTHLSFYAVDLSGNVSPIQTLKYEIDDSFPTIEILYQSSPVVSGETSQGPSPTMQIHWQSDMKGTFQVEISGNGNMGSGDYYYGGDIEKDTREVTSIKGVDLAISNNKIYIFVTNALGKTAISVVNVLREDVAPMSSVGVASGLYGSALDVTISVYNEQWMNALYYTTDGTDPKKALDEPDTNGDDSSDICTIPPYRPRPGWRCKIRNSTYTNPIHLEPYMPTGCTVLNCEPLVTLKFFAIDAGGNVEQTNEVTYQIDMVLPVVNIIANAIRVRRDGVLKFDFDSSEDGQYQVAIDPISGEEAAWSAGIIVREGSVTGAATNAITISGSNFTGQSGDRYIIVVRTKDKAGHIGMSAFDAYLDNMPPTVTPGPGGGSYGWVQFNTTGTYSNGVQLNALDGFTPSGAIQIHYTLDGSDPTEDSSTINGGGYVDLLTPQEKSEGLTGTKSVILKYFAIDEAGNKSFLKEALYDIAPDGVSMDITVPAPSTDLVIPRGGESSLKFANSIGMDMEYSVCLQWRNACSAAPSGEEILSGVIKASDSEWVSIKENLFPGMPDVTSGTFTDKTASAGAEDYLEVSSAMAADYSIGSYITYNFDGVIRKITDIQGTQVFFSPPLDAPSGPNVDINYWGNSERVVCIYSRAVDSGGEWLSTSKVARSDFDAPQVIADTSEPNWKVSSKVDWISHQYLASGGYAIATVRFKILGVNPTDPTASPDRPAHYNIRKIEMVNGQEVAGGIIASGAIMATNQTVSPIIPATEITPGEGIPCGETDPINTQPCNTGTMFRVFVTDQNGNVGKGNLATIYRNENPFDYTLSGSTCPGTASCSVGFSATYSNGVPTSVTLPNELVPLTASGSVIYQVAIDQLLSTPGKADTGIYTLTLSGSSWSVGLSGSKNYYINSNGYEMIKDLTWSGGWMGSNIGGNYWSGTSSITWTSNFIYKLNGNLMSSANYSVFYSESYSGNNWIGTIENSNGSTLLHSSFGNYNVSSETYTDTWGKWVLDFEYYSGNGYLDFNSLLFSWTWHYFYNSIDIINRSWDENGSSIAFNISANETNNINLSTIPVCMTSIQPGFLTSAPMNDYCKVIHPNGNVTALYRYYTLSNSYQLNPKYTGSKIFSYTNEYGLKSSLYVTCDRDTGCVGSGF